VHRGVSRCKLHLLIIRDGRVQRVFLVFTEHCIDSSRGFFFFRSVSITTTRSSIVCVALILSKTFKGVVHLHSNSLELVLFVAYFSSTDRIHNTTLLFTQSLSSPTHFLEQFMAQI